MAEDDTPRSKEPVLKGKALEQRLLQPPANLPEGWIAAAEPYDMHVPQPIEDLPPLPPTIQVDEIEERLEEVRQNVLEAQPDAGGQPIGKSYFYGPEGFSPPLSVSEGTPYIQVNVLEPGASRDMDLPDAAADTELQEGDSGLRAHVMATGSEDVVVQAPLSVTQEQFERFASTVLQP